jgi:tetratricopeptide (TPR) repeat protein
LTKAIELEPDFAEAYLNRGGLYFAKRLSGQAIADFTEAIELKPDFAVAYCNRGVAFGGKGLYEQAIADSTKAIEPRFRGRLLQPWRHLWP